MSFVDREQPVLVIGGATASGKSAIAMSIAERFPVVIISADSRQIYRGFDIGTAKPSRLDLDSVPHKCIDVADPTERWSAWQWCALARASIVEALEEGRIPIVVGGTGFYIKALVSPLAELPAFDENRLGALRDWMNRQDSKTLRHWCRSLDPIREEFGPVQWKRAIEVALLTGKRISVFHSEAQADSIKNVRYLIVDPGPSIESKIQDRTRAMFRDGWVDEVRRLIFNVPDNAPAWQATGYEDVKGYIRGDISQDEAEQRVILRTRQFAKRQRTWFRNQVQNGMATYIDPTNDDAIDSAISWVESNIKGSRS